ncbi:MAG TPA: hypothetical protein VLZ74_03795 [Methylocella sp.]|nr:hypothetical protein [Methylocella sp.]
MPTFDGGHYFLTVLVPVRTDPIPDGPAFTSPVHALRKQLAMLPTAAQTPACGGGQSPFARNTRNHFARFVIIDDVAYNGREPTNTLLAQLKNINPTIAQPQDHLTCPFLFFAAEFDAESGAESERDSYLATLWDTMKPELQRIFTFCVGFDAGAQDAASFAQYIARCQIETTMSFNDYYVDIAATVKGLPVWPEDKSKYVIPAIIGGILLVLGLFAGWSFSGSASLVLLLLGGGTLAAVGWHAYTSIMAAGAKAFPAAPDSNLPAVLKALYLQRTFTRFAIDNQLLAIDAQSARDLHAAFGHFIATHRPEDLNGPTQQPGIIGI